MTGGGADRCPRVRIVLFVLAGLLLVGSAIADAQAGTIGAALIPGALVLLLAGGRRARRDTPSQVLDPPLASFASSIAHEVNNLLTVQLGNLDLLAHRHGRAGAAEPDFGTTLAEEALQAGTTISRLMQRLHAVSRRPPAPPRVVAIGALLRHLEPVLRRAVGRRVTLGIRCATAVPAAWIDPGGLSGAILHLALDAADAMPDGGALAIAAEAAEPPGQVVVTLTAAGVGTAEDAFAGPGLPVAATLVRRAGGTLQRGGEGLDRAVRLWLPCPPGTAPRSP